MMPVHCPLFFPVRCSLRFAPAIWEQWVTKWTVMIQDAASLQSAVVGEKGTQAGSPRYTMINRKSTMLGKKHGLKLFTVNWSFDEATIPAYFSWFSLFTVHCSRCEPIFPYSEVLVQVAVHCSLSSRQNMAEETCCVYQKWFSTPKQVERLPCKLPV